MLANAAILLKQAIIPFRSANLQGIDGNPQLPQFNGPHLNDSGHSPLALGGVDGPLPVA